MFGHVRGAFTDARQDRKGRFEVADGGTIFLDEIGELDPGSQVKLLRVLQDRTFELLGSSRARTVDVRVISATNRQLSAPEFREDLLYRLNLITVTLPPLRERRGDIPQLASHFLRLAAQRYGRETDAVSPRAVEWLKSQNWPGNIRQLKQTIERAVLMHDARQLDAEDFTVSDAQPRDVTLPEPGAMTLDEIERSMILKCMKAYDGNISKVADALGLSRAALYRRLEKYDIAAS
jgi:DNA-binding NtrC family response regulator